MDTWKPSTALGAVALALFTTSVTALTGTPHEMAWFGWLFLIVFSGVLALAHLGGGAIRAGLFVAEKGAEVWATWFYEPPVPPAALGVWADETEPAEPEPDIAADWRAACHRFLVAGARYGFGVRVLYPMGFVTWDDWGTMLAYLAEAGILVRKPAAGWADGWSLERWYEKGHSYPLPYRDEAPPTVALSPTTTTVNSAQQAKQAREGVIVEGVVK